MGTHALRAIALGTGLAVAAAGCSGRQPEPRIDAGPVVDASSVDAATPVDAAHADAPPPDTTCASVVVDATPTPPNVMFVIDRSGSMNIRLVYPDGPRRWDAVGDALFGPSGVVTMLEDEVRFGVALYFQDVTADIAIVGCPQMRTVPAVLSNRAAIQTLFDSNDPWGNDPTGAAVEQVVVRAGELIPSRSEGRTVIVLATDGDGASCEDPLSIPIGRAVTLDRVRAAHDTGIDTYVLSVGGSDEAQAHLQEVANAGRGVLPGEPDAPFWNGGEDATGLADAIRTIIERVVSCQLELDGMIRTADACYGTVTLGSTTLECNTDWRAIDETHIEVLGDACERLQGTTDELVARFPCDVVF